MALPETFELLGSVELKDTRKFKLPRTLIIKHEGHELARITCSKRFFDVFGGMPKQEAGPATIDSSKVYPDFAAPDLLEAIKSESDGLVAFGDAYAAWEAYIRGNAPKLLGERADRENGFFALGNDGKPHYARLTRTSPGSWVFSMPAGPKIIRDGTCLLTTRAAVSPPPAS